MKLCEAAASGNLAEVRWLCDEWDLESKDESSYTPLMRASTEGHLLVVEYLVSKGANINSRTVYGATPLMCAAVSGHKTVVESLIRFGADTGILAENGESAADMARAHGYEDIARLIEAGLPPKRPGEANGPEQRDCG
jgi:ankyrin repeat protein